MNFPDRISEEELQILTKELELLGWKIGWGTEAVWAAIDGGARWEHQVRYDKILRLDKETRYRLAYHPDTGWVDELP